MVFHVTNKSIAEFKIFNSKRDYMRIILAMCYYLNFEVKVSLKDFLRTKLSITPDNITPTQILGFCNKKQPIRIIAYCIMPTHVHFLLDVLKLENISKYINDVLNSYTRYFNIKHNRKGPLWEGKTKKVSVKTDEALLHVTRYIHLNPVTAYIVDKPESWLYSSYNEYISEISFKKRICNFSDILDIESSEYKKFVNDRIAYQRELAQIKHLIIEQPSQPPRLGW